MPKPFKVALIVLAALAVVLVAAGALLAALFDPDDTKSLLVERVRRDHQRTLTIPGRIGLSLFPRIGIELGAVTLSEQRSSETFASLRSARMSLALWPLLHRQVVVDRIRVDGLQARLTRFADGHTSIDDLLGAPRAKADPAPDTDTVPLRVEVGGIDVNDAAITIDDRAGGRRVELTKLAIESGRIAAGVPIEASIKGHLKSDRPAVEGDMALEGTVLADPAGRRCSVPKFSLRLGLLQAKGSAAVDFDGPRLEATLAGKFDQSSFDAKLGMRGSPAVFSADLDIDRIDLDRYRRPAAAGTAPAGAAAATPIDLSALRDLDATANLRIGTLQAAQMTASNVRLGLRGGGGRIEATPISAELYQGRLSGSASATTTAAPRFTIRQTLTGIAVGPLLKDALGHDRVEGHGNLVLDLSTAGGSARALQKALAGTARIELRDGAVRGIDLARAVRSARTKAGAPAAVTATAARGERTEFGELSASFAIARGVAHNEDLVATTALLRFGGSGDIDLGEGRLDYVVKVTVAGSPQGDGGRELQWLRGRTVPIHLRGPFDANGYRIDVGDLALEAVKQQLGDRLQRLLGR